MIDGTKEFCSRLTKGDKVFLLEILRTRKEDLLRDAKKECTQDKAYTIAMVATFQKIHKKKPTEVTKRIVNKLNNEIASLNRQIANLDTLIKDSKK